jgi:DNA-binding LacI/PurR family transcriptional regulator
MNLPRITTAMLVVTHDCNLRCRYCFVDKNPCKMTYETAKAAAEFVIKNAEEDKVTPGINFFGGEPMLMWDSIIVPLVNWVRHEYKKPFHFGITTNGTLLNEERIQFMKDNNFDGAFIAGLNETSPLLDELKNTDIPTVLYDNVLIGEKVATINNESINTIRKLVNMLYNDGHRKIGFIHGDKYSFVSNERFAGYITGQIMNDIDYDPKYVYFGHFSEETGYEAAKYFANTDVTAVVCASDIIAIGLIKGLNDLGLSVPNDISVTGYDDLDISKYVTPSLTTVKQDLDLIGEKALSTLLSMMMNRSSQRIVINGDIIIRNSTSKVKER